MISTIGIDQIYSMQDLIITIDSCLVCTDCTDCDNDHNDFTYTGTDGTSNKCEFCNISFDKYNLKKHTTIVHKTKNKFVTCYLCNVVVNFEKHHIGRVMLVQTNLSQLEINVKTIEYLSEHKKIPLPSHLDNAYTRIAENPYLYILNKLHFGGSDDKKNVKLFFTNIVQKDLLTKQYPKTNKYCLEYFVDTENTSNTTDKKMNSEINSFLHHCGDRPVQQICSTSKKNIEKKLSSVSELSSNVAQIFLS